MPPKKSTNPTPGSSGSQQVASGRPQLLGKHLNAEELDLIFFAYNRYRYEGRPLLREEICGIIGLRFDKEPPHLRNAKNLLDNFDNPRHPLSVKYQGSTAGKVEALEPSVNDMFHTYLQKDEEAKATAEYLKGMNQRLVTPNWHPWPKWNKVKISPYKLFSLHVIANDCKKADGSEMDEFSRYDAARKCYFDGVQSDTYIMNTLATTNEKSTDMSKLIMVDKGFFLRKTQEVIDQHMTRDEAPRVVIPPEYRSDPVSFTTKALEDFTLGATAPSLAQPTARIGGRPIPSNSYDPIVPSPYQQGPYQPSGPGPSPSTNPGLYRGPSAALGLPTASGVNQQSASASTQPIGRGPAYNDKILRSSSESSEEVEDEEEEESQKLVERGGGKEKGKRQRSETPGVEAESHQPRRRAFDPRPKRPPYDPVRDG